MASQHSVIWVITMHCTKTSSSQTSERSKPKLSMILYKRLQIGSKTPKVVQGQVLFGLYHVLHWDCIFFKFLNCQNLKCERFHLKCRVKDLRVIWLWPLSPHWSPELFTWSGHLDGCLLPPSLLHVYPSRSCILYWRRWPSLIREDHFGAKSIQIATLFC